MTILQKLIHACISFYCVLLYFLYVHERTLLQCKWPFVSGPFAFK